MPVIDGTKDAEYGAALSVQNTNTQFGDNNLGDLIATRSGGSEIDQVFGLISGGRLYITITGNLERNFNKLEIFLDTKTGGVASIDGSALPDQVDGYCCSNNSEGDGAQAEREPARRGQAQADGDEDRQAEADVDTAPTCHRGRGTRFGSRRRTRRQRIG